MTTPLLSKIRSSITSLRLCCSSSRLSGVLLLLAAFTPALSAQPRSPKQLDSALRARYRTDQDAPVFARVMIVGLKGDAPLCSRDMGAPRNCSDSRTRESIRVRDGQVQKSGLLGKLVGTGDQAFAVRDSVQITSVHIGLLSTILIEVRSTRAVTRNKTAFAFEGSVQFEFDKNRLKESPIEEIFAAIDAVLEPLPGMTFRETIRLGDSLDEVRAVLGKPRGSKTSDDTTIERYENFQVTYVKGHVIEIH